MQICFFPSGDKELFLATSWNPDCIVISSEGEREVLRKQKKLRNLFLPLSVPVFLSRPFHQLFHTFDERFTMNRFCCARCTCQAYSLFHILVSNNCTCSIIALVVNYLHYYCREQFNNIALNHHHVRDHEGKGTRERSVQTAQSILLFSNGGVRVFKES